ncbi:MULTISPECIES: pyridoxine 5'-phosphate synthase [Brevundimonas]|uniref:pyridoxine 5'-phosphate synthase n=1 Tax=Brevundimonas TaxID=41275 RepID=UPI0019084C44|nr:MULTISPECIES: pyridoxine 5'-phosphate synthase [Brevundimonas]MBK1969011.1 pyridoxine 5'-phosphate synthase [Brevundimonas diminuta]MBK1975170.1 pyridoxine 5'-phosphate synthase [Brevundimonas diminuta]MDA0743652.1 pyridoxine 5'-phosphate synthase [Pseudomonadota bacterium]MDM8351600.1 pyridoxine 5'-phosphate synthase [Brevundimonas diminuta]
MKRQRVRLGVNIDHVATVRNARGGAHPDPARAAEGALAAGADGITAHLREDRRHITDADIDVLTALCRRADKPLNFEMAVTEEMLAIALRHRPHAACLVPERREEVTTEGGLAVAGHEVRIAPVVKALSDAGIRVSLFIEPSEDQVEAAAAVGAQVVEFHTGRYCHLTDPAVRAAEFDRLAAAAAQADILGLEVHAGHGLDYASASEVLAIREIVELNIGHFLIGEAVFVGLDAAIRRMRAAMDEAISGSGS